MQEFAFKRVEVKEEGNNWNDNNFTKHSHNNS